MSVSRNKLRKERREKRTEEEKDIARKIRSGELPRYFFARADGQFGALERRNIEGIRVMKDGKIAKTLRRKRTWRLISTYNTLTRLK